MIKDQAAGLEELAGSELSFGLDVAAFGQIAEQVVVQSSMEMDKAFQKAHGNASKKAQLLADYL